MSKHYTAFISYRHLPLDIAVAEQLHRLLERFRVPRDYRRNPRQKTLGTVFRDRDELPLSNDLTQDIYEALDHADFLIVICTPETPKSLWVEKEIQHFIQVHGRDRVLTVLAAGTPETSIPTAITHVYADDGITLLEEREPLCAYLVEDSRQKILKNLKKELPRLAAAILQCPYDALVQRSRQYRMRQLAALGAVSTAVALGYVGMLLSKNEQIRQQLWQTQYQQSQALTLLSASQLESGSRLAALESALTALPSQEEDRPYYAPAREALANALYVYGSTEYRRDTLIQQDTPIQNMILSEDGRYAVTLDAQDTLRCFDLRTEEECWQFSSAAYQNNYASGGNYTSVLEFLPGQSALRLVHGIYDYSLSLETGEVLTCQDYEGLNHKNLALSPKGDQQATVVMDKDDPGAGYYLALLSTLQDDGLVAPIPASSISQIAGNYSQNGGTFALLVNSPVREDGAYRGESVALHLYSPEGQLLYTLPLDQWEKGDASNLTVISLDDGSFLAGYMHSQTYFISHVSSQGQLLAQGSMELEPGSYKDPIQVAAQMGNYGCYLYNNQFYCIQIDTCTPTEPQPLPEGMAFLGTNGDGSFLLQEGDHILHRYAILSGQELRSYYTTVLGAPAYILLNEIELVQLSSQEFEDPLLRICFAGEEAGVFLLISQEDPCSARVFRRMGDENWEALPFGFPAYAGGGMLKISPQGNWLEMRYDVYGCAHLFDLETQTLQQIDDPDYSDGLTFSADESRIIRTSSDYVELATGQVHSPEGKPQGTPENRLQAVVQPNDRVPGQPALSALYQEGTLHWWLDGEAHGSSESPYALSWDPYDMTLLAGQNGLILLQDWNSTQNWDKSAPTALTLVDTADGSWQQLTLPSGLPGFPETCLGRTSKVLAIADLDNVLRIYDAAQGAVVQEIPLSIASATVETMQFLKEDSAVLLRDSLYFIIIDLTSGQEVGKFYHGASTGFSLCNVQEDLEKQQLYLSEPAGEIPGLILDMETWTLIQEVPHMAGYLPSQNSILCCPGYGQDLMLYPNYSLEDLMTMAQQQLNG